MPSNSVSWKQILVTILPLLHLVASTHTYTTPHKYKYTRRADEPKVPDDGPVCESSPSEDGPTDLNAPGPPGLGFEFETWTIKFGSDTCSKDDTDKAKGKIVNDRKGASGHWKLTADTTPVRAGLLTAEYILLGEKIKLTEGTARKAAEEVANDIKTWDPSATMQDPHVTIEDNACKDWKIVSPAKSGGTDEMLWGAQATAPLALESISDLFYLAETNQANLLLPYAESSVFVFGSFFRDKPNGLENPDKDILGFFSMIMSYIKVTKEDLLPDTSYKSKVAIMPRSDFSVLYEQIAGKMPEGDLYDIVKQIACYKNLPDMKIGLDEDFCTDDDDKGPKPNGEMDKRRFRARNSAGEDKTTSIKDWVKSMQDKQHPDTLSDLDKVVDGSIGRLGKATEQLLDNPDRAIPIFEFRRTPDAFAPRMADLVRDVEDAIIALHRAIPKKLRKRECGPPAKNTVIPTTLLTVALTGDAYTHIPQKTSSTSSSPPEPSLPPFAGGTCHVSVKQVQTLFAVGFDSTYAWSGFVTDGKDKQIDGCEAPVISLSSSDTFEIKCPPFSTSVTVKIDPKKDENLDFAVGEQKWSSSEVGKCEGSTFSPDPNDGSPTRNMKCGFKCG